MPRRTTASITRAIGLMTGMALSVALVACAPGAEPSAPPSATTIPPTAGETSAPEPVGPVLLPEGSATDNLPLFAAITAQVWASDQRVHGRAYIDALAAAGFDKTAMQVTADETTVGNPAESIQFSVRWGDVDCLVGQVGPSTGEPVATVTSQLAEGRCLIGETRPIDW